jgi:hypothetical protein
MGLIAGLLTLPLAPIRATMWVAELVERQAEQEASVDESEILAALAALGDARRLGELSDEEIELAENDLLESLMAMRGLDVDGRYGDGELG